MTSATFLKMLVQGNGDGVSRNTRLDLAEVRHGGAEFCDFDGEIRGSLVFTILVSEKVM